MKLNTLMQRIKEVKEAGESYNNSNKLRDQKKEIEAFQTVHNELVAKFNSTQDIYLDMIKLDKSIKVDFASISADIRVLLTKVTQDEFDKILVNSIKRELNKINDTLTQRWKEYIDSRTSAISNVIQTLKPVILTEDTVKLEQKKFVFSTCSAGSSDGVRTINDYIELYNSIITKLEISEDKLEFIRLLTSNQKVSIAELTPELFEWLQNSEFANKICLTIK